MSAIASIIFDKDYWDLPAAKRWLLLHEFHPIKKETTKRYYRFRLLDPSMFSRFRTKSFDQRFKFIIGFY